MKTGVNEDHDNGDDHHDHHDQGEDEGEKEQEEDDEDGGRSRVRFAAALPRVSGKRLSRAKPTP